MTSRSLIASLLFARLSLPRLISFGFRLVIGTFIIFSAVCSMPHEIVWAEGSLGGQAKWQPSSDSALAYEREEELTVTLTGELTVLHADDFAKKRGQFFYFLKDHKSKKTFNLHFPKKPPGTLMSGAVMRVRGKAKGHDIFLAADGAGEKGVETILPAPAMVAGEQKTIIMVVNFLDVEVSCSTDAITDLMFTDPDDKSVDDLYQESSFGNISFIGDVVGPYTIDYESSDPCAYSAWSVAADAAAQADGVDLTAYGRRVYVFPGFNRCGFAGIGTIGGFPSRAWVFSCGMEDVFAHELGHNLGMNHAATPTDEYGDRSDVMGMVGLGLRQHNAPHKDQMGWLPPEQILTVTENGVYDIAPLEVNPSEAVAHQILKILKPDTSVYYYISYRRPLGFDQELQSNYRDRLNVHRYTGAGAIRTYFLDSLLEGETFADTSNGIAFTPLSSNSGYITVRVTTSATCSLGAPEVILSPVSQEGEPGMTLNYTLTVTNRDSSHCADTAFSLNPSLPTGWTSVLSLETLTLAPGETGSATLALTSPAETAGGTYSTSVGVSDGADPIHTASASASYVVTAVDATPPAAPEGLRILKVSRLNYP